MPLLSSLLRREDRGLRLPLLVGDTHQGLVRAQNEDSYLTISGPKGGSQLLGVADGMGGHECGEVASQLCMHYLLREWHGRREAQFHSREAIYDFLSQALSRANRHICHVNKVLRIRFPMGTTATVAVHWQDKLIIGHVGDSRCYRLRRNRLRQLTSDHNWQSEMIRQGMFTRNDAAVHPLSNMLTNCVGAVPNLRVDFVVSTTMPGDRFLICSDGVTSMITDQEVQDILAVSSEAADAVKRLIHQALRNGGLDNITAICLFQ
jgi:PPM family protein phosphatase